MKVIVTGAAGSIGSRLCRRLAECGVSVLALDKDRVVTAPEVVSAQSTSRPGTT